MVLNVINPSKGSFQWYGGKLSTHQALKKIGAIIERPNFYPYMTALQNLKLICKIKQCKTEKIQDKLELVGLWDRRNSKFRTYSLGMKQRLAIAAALVNDPELLILDEPTNGLDPEGIHQIRKLIVKIAEKGTTILLASHLLDEVEKVCNHVIVLKNGVKYPGNEHMGAFGCDSYDISGTVDGTGSKGALHGLTKFSMENCPPNQFFLEYIARPQTAEIFFEDVLMALVFYGMPILAENNKPRLLYYLKRRGYRGYSMNRPDRTWNKLSTAEKEVGGIPNSSEDIKQAHAAAIEMYIQDHVGKKRDGSHGDLYFNKSP